MTDSVPFQRRRLLHHSKLATELLYQLETFSARIL